MSDHLFINNASLRGELNRRGFFKWNALLAGTMAAARGCARGLILLEKGASSESAVRRPDRVLRVGCPSHNCGGKCLLKVHVKDGVITRIEGDDRPTDEVADPQLRACVRGRAYRRRQYPPDRLKYPMKRIGKRGTGKFERISWDEALYTMAAEMQRIKQTYGNSAMYGFTDKSATSLIPLAQAWNHPPTVTNPKGCESRGHRQTERAYRFVPKASFISFTLNGSEETPVHNPCFVIKHWTGENKSRLEVNGKELAPCSKSFRQGMTRDVDGTLMLVVWVELESVSPVRFAIEEGEG